MYIQSSAVCGTQLELPRVHTRCGTVSLEASPKVTLLAGPMDMMMFPAAPNDPAAAPGMLHVVTELYEFGTS